MCGILDNLGNKLCLPQNESCPLNYITTNKLDLKYSYYGSANLATKTVYYSNQSTENGKIFGGLFVDSDLLIKYNDEDCEKLEEGTVKSLLDNHPYKLYRKSLSYDPYKKNTNGKTYLKWCVPGVGKEKNISKIKDLMVEYHYNITTNDDIINPIKTSIATTYFISLPGYIGFFFILIVFILSFFEQNKIHSISSRFRRCYKCYGFFKFLIYIIFASSIVLFIFGTTLACVNIKTLSIGNSLNSGIITSLKSLNIIVICLNIILFILFLVFIIYLCITPKYLFAQEILTQKKIVKDKIDEINIEMNDSKNSDDAYYNSSDFKINNNEDDYYNSSDYKNNLLTNTPQQTYSGFDNKVGSTYQ